MRLGQVLRLSVLGLKTAGISLASALRHPQLDVGLVGLESMSFVYSMPRPRSPQSRLFLSHSLAHKHNTSVPAAAPFAKDRGHSYTATALAPSCCLYTCRFFVLKEYTTLPNRPAGIKTLPSALHVVTSSQYSVQSLVCVYVIRNHFHFRGLTTPRPFGSRLPRAQSRPGAGRRRTRRIGAAAWSGCVCGERKETV